MYDNFDLYDFWEQEEARQERLEQRRQYEEEHADDKWEDD